jgi:hypothetical protein
LSAIALFLCDEAPAQAQAPKRAPLPAKLMLRYRRARSGAPLAVVWKFRWDELTVARGELQYEVYDEHTPLGEFRIPDFILPPGKSEFNALLPAFFVGNASTMLTIRGRFVTSGRAYDFEEQSLRVPTLDVQWCNVGIASSGQTVTPEAEMKFFEKLRLETLLPAEAVTNQSATTTFDVKPADIPSDPLTFCNFDIFVLTPPALAALRQDQSTALKKWVLAGGSVCIVTGEGLEARHAELLNELTSEAPKRARFVVGPNGRLLPDEDPPDKILRAPKGLGRVAVFREKLLQTISPDGATWLTTAGFLLKERSNKIVPPESDADNSGAPFGAPPIAAVGRGVIQVPGRSPWYGGSLRAAPLGHLDELFALLMPLGVSTIPLGVIALILAAYVLTIGPVDYFLLGSLRLRRLTWVLFPLVTIGFATYTLWLSQRYLGSTDSRRAIEIYDVVPGGAVARRSRIELLFLSRENTAATQVENGLFASVGRSSVVMSRGPVPEVPLNNTPETIAVDDRFPNSYQIAQQIPQWRPVLNRFFWIDPKPAAVYAPPDLPGAAGFDWEHAVDPQRNRGGVSLDERVRRAFGPKACAMVLRGPEMMFVLNDLKEMEHWKTRQDRGMDDPFGLNYLTATIRALCQRTPDELFRYTSSLSPNGGPELDDLAVADSTNPDQSVLVIAFETESTLYLYRCVYSGSP